MLDARVHLLTSVATLPYSRSAFFNHTRSAALRYQFQAGYSFLGIFVVKNSYMIVAFDFFCATAIRTIALLIHSKFGKTKAHVVTRKLFFTPRTRGV